MKYLGTMLLLTAATTAAHASSVAADSLCTNTSITSHDASVTPGVAAVAAFSGCSSTSIADYGVLKTGSTVTNPSTTGNASASFTIWFSVNDPSKTTNDHFDLLVPVNYDLTISENGGDGGAFTYDAATFSMTEQDVSISPFFYVATSSRDANSCAEPLPTVPSCNGHYTGTAYIDLQVHYNNLSRLWITVGGQIFVGANGGTSTFDALHTVTLGQTIIPDGATFSYDSDITGNPMNFTTAASTATPEPSTWAIFAGCLLTLAAFRRRSQTRIG